MRKACVLRVNTFIIWNFSLFASVYTRSMKSNEWKKYNSYTQGLSLRLCKIRATKNFLKYYKIYLIIQQLEKNFLRNVSKFYKKKRKRKNWLNTKKESKQLNVVRKTVLHSELTSSLWQPNLKNDLLFKKKNVWSDNLRKKNLHQGNKDARQGPEYTNIDAWYYWYIYILIVWRHLNCTLKLFIRFHYHFKN